MVFKILKYSIKIELGYFLENKSHKNNTVEKKIKTLPYKSVKLVIFFLKKLIF